MDNSYDIILLNVLIFYGLSVYMNILHSTKILKTSPANSCLPNLYPSSSARGPKVRTTKVELQHPRWWHLRWRKPTNGVDGHESESIQAVNYCLSPTLTSGYLKVLGEIMAEIERETCERGTNSKIKKDGHNILQSLPGFLGALEVQPTSLFACEIPRKPRGSQRSSNSGRTLRGARQNTMI